MELIGKKIYDNGVPIVHLNCRSVFMSNVGITDEIDEDRYYHCEECGNALEDCTCEIRSEDE